MSPLASLKMRTSERAKAPAASSATLSSPALRDAVALPENVNVRELPVVATSPADADAFHSTSFTSSFLPYSNLGSLGPARVQRTSSADSAGQGFPFMVPGHTIGV